MVNVARVAAVQMDIALGDRDANRAHALEMTRRALDEGAKLVVTPEMWLTGYALPEFDTLAEDAAGVTVQVFSALAKEYAAHILIGIPERKDGKFFNAAIVLDPSGQVAAHYRKIHLFGLMAEHWYLAEGERPVTVDILGQPTGLAICYDLRFPELFRGYALSGTRIFLVPAEWPNPRLSHWRTLLVARAIENQSFVIAANRVGRDANNTFFGHSMIVDPWGEILAEGGEAEEIVSVEIDLDAVTEIRSRIPVFQDRRPAAYAAMPESYTPVGR